MHDMNVKKTVFALLFTSAFGAISVPAMADVVVQFAPPADRYETVPPPRRGYVWENGHYEWRNGRYVWIRGHWERARPGYVHVQPRWHERNGRWYYESRRWDRDRDGIPNRYDRDRDNDGIPNNADRDRDGDGVPNRYDNAPNNPRRS
jgi:hypothetical protein